MSAKPLPGDAFVNNAFNRAAIAVGMNDHEAAFELVRELHALEGKVFLSIVPPVGTAAQLPTARDAESGFFGVPIAAKFRGRCSVCSGAVEVGAEVLYDREQRKVAHMACGEVRA